MGVHLLTGSDAVLLEEAAAALVKELVGDVDRGRAVDELSADDVDLGDIVMAAATPSMFGERIVVARHLARYGAKQVAPLLGYLTDPAPDTELVLVWSEPATPGVNRVALPKAVKDAVAAAGGTVRSTDAPGQARARDAWVDEQLAASGLRLDAAARRLVVERLGEDVARLGGLCKVLRGVHGDGARLGPAEVEPYLGDAGGVPPWDLTDAIEAGDVARATTVVRRMVLGGGRHPLQVLASLTTWADRLLRLDGAPVGDEREAAALLGMKGSTYPAKKALAQARSLGHGGVARTVELLAAAEVDLKGRTGLAPEAVVEVLVARLARTSGGGRRSGARRR